MTSAGYKKEPARMSRSFNFVFIIVIIVDVFLHQVSNLNSSVVLVLIPRGWVSQVNSAGAIRCSERVSNHTISSFEANLRLEGVLTNGTNHLQRNVWAIE